MQPLREQNRQVGNRSLGDQYQLAIGAQFVKLHAGRVALAGGGEYQRLSDSGDEKLSNIVSNDVASD